MKKLVLIDDWEQTTERVREAVGTSYEILIASPKKGEALSMVIEEKPDIILLSWILLKDAIGVDMLKRIKKALPKVILILTTTVADLESFLMNAGADAVVHKPFDLGKLREIIDEKVAGI